MPKRVKSVSEKSPTNSAPSHIKVLTNC